ncbi:Kinesin-like protein KIN-10C [Linum perenne]
MAQPTPENAHRSMASLSRKVRVVAKIRGLTDSEVLPGKAAPEGKWISVSKPNGEDSDGVTVTLGEQSASSKECFEIGYCYEETEGNEVIFKRDVEPLLPGVFKGCNATVVACGARGSGKTHFVQGTDEESGLTTLSMAEILRMAEENNKSVTISCFEILQERAHDLLEPKAEEVMVLKDGQGRVQLKGLSCVQVKSLAEFQKLYRGLNRTVRRLNQKMTTPLPSRSTKGLIVYISSHGEKFGRAPVGKINFIELAGYEDARRTSNAGNFGENAQVNKSIHALFKVVYSLHTNENHVAYRESKLSRMLEDSLGGKSRILIVTCLNPLSCQDSMNMLILASRCCQSTTRAMDSARKTNSTTRSKVFASHKSRLQGTGSVSSMRKQQTPSNLPVPGKKAGGNVSALKARKLFDDKYNEKSEKKRNRPVVASVTESCSQEEACSSSFSLTTATSSVQEVEVLSLNFEDIHSVSSDVQVYVLSFPFHEPLEYEISELLICQESQSVAVSGPCTSSSFDTVSVEHIEENLYVDMTPATKTLSVVEEGRSLDDKENDKLLINEGVSPPISSRLQEISNTLKQLFTSTPSYEAMPSSYDPSFLQDQISISPMVLTTPECNATANNNALDISTTMIPCSINIPSSNDASLLQDRTSTPSIKPLIPELNTTADKTLDITKTMINDTSLYRDQSSTPSKEPLMPELNPTADNNLEVPSSNDPSLLWDQTSTPCVKPLTPELNTTANNTSDITKAISHSINDPLIQDQTSTPSIKPLMPELNTTANNTLDIPDSFKDLSSHISTVSIEPKTPECSIRGANNTALDIASFCSPWEKLNRSNCSVKNSLVQEYLSFINTANKEDLKKLKVYTASLGIGEKRATYIMELREDSPFKDLDELKDVGMSAKQIKDMVGKNVLGGLFS